MIEKAEIIAYIKDKFNTEPSYPWSKYPDYAVFRHKDSAKWYGLIMNVSRLKLGLEGEGNAWILNLKCDPELNSLIRGQQGVLPAYHMNKEHWVTIVLDSPFPEKDLYRLIDLSYDLTK